MKKTKKICLFNLDMGANSIGFEQSVVSRYLVQLWPWCSLLPITFAPPAPGMPPRWTRLKRIEHQNFQQRPDIWCWPWSSPHLCTNQACHHQENGRDSLSGSKKVNTIAQDKQGAELSASTYDHQLCQRPDRMVGRIGSRSLSERILQPDGSRPGLGLQLGGCCCLRIQLAGFL